MLGSVSPSSFLCKFFLIIFIHLNPIMIFNVILQNKQTNKKLSPKACVYFDLHCKCKSESKPYFLDNKFSHSKSFILLHMVKPSCSLQFFA